MKKSNTTKTLKIFDISNLCDFSLGDMDGEKDQKFKESTFIFTHSAKKVVKNQKYNYVYGNFGSGKSALAKAMENNLGNIHEPNTNIVSINEAFSLHTDFLDKNLDNSFEKKSLIPLWSFYIAKKLVDNILRKYNEADFIVEFKREIADYEVLNQEFSFNYSIINLLREWNLSIAVSCNGLPFEVAPKLENSKKLRPLRLNCLYKSISDFYRKNNINTVIIIDRVEDFVRYNVKEDKRIYIESLHDAIEEIRTLDNIRPILFVRNDIFEHISPTIGSMKVKDRSIKLEWKNSELLELVHYRLTSIKECPLKLRMKQLRFSFKLKLLLKVLKKITKFDFLKEFTNTDFVKLQLYKFFPKTVKNTDFFVYLEKELFPNSDINPRIAIKFFNTLFDIQYEFNSERHLMEQLITPNINGEYDIFSENCILVAIEKVKEECLDNVFSTFPEERDKEFFRTLHNEYYKKTLPTPSKKMKEFLSRKNFSEDEINYFISHLMSINYLLKDSDKINVSELYKIKLPTY